MQLNSFTPTKPSSYRPRENALGAELRKKLIGIIDEHAHYAPRSQQVRLGPSEIGIECPRQLAYKLAQAEKANPRDAHWLATIGTAVHSWLEGALRTDNSKDGVDFLVEQRVPVSDYIKGTTDAFWIPRGVVIDWKIVGENSMRQYQSQISHQYRVQAHSYGKGMVNAGYKVEHVAVVFLPRWTQDLNTHTWVWNEPYDSTIVDRALERLDSIQTLVDGLALRTDPSQFVRVPTVVGNSCKYCEWSAPTSFDNGLSCPKYFEAEKQTIALRNTETQK